MLNIGLIVLVSPSERTLTELRTILLFFINILRFLYEAGHNGRVPKSIIFLRKCLFFYLLELPNSEVFKDCWVEYLNLLEIVYFKVLVSLFARVVATFFGQRQVYAL